MTFHQLLIMEYFMRSLKDVLGSKINSAKLTYPHTFGPGVLIPISLEDYCQVVLLPGLPVPKHTEAVHFLSTTLSQAPLSCRWALTSPYSIPRPSSEATKMAKAVPLQKVSLRRWRQDQEWSTSEAPTVPPQQSSRDRLISCLSRSPSYLPTFDLHLNSLAYQPLVRHHLINESLTFRSHFCTVALCYPVSSQSKDGKSCILRQCHRCQSSLRRISQFCEPRTE